MIDTGEYNRLVGEVLCFIDGELDLPFGEVALQVFAWQFQHNAPYQAYCRSLGINTTTAVESWREIPAVPTDAFKIESQPLCAFSPDECIFCFQTSGTTGSVSGRHYMHTGTTYHSSIRAGWRHAGLPELPLFSVTPPSPDCRHSSLAYMFLALGAGNLLHPDGHLMTEHLAEHTGPVVLMATALTFLHLMESENGIPRLPEGSWLMETGGYKGTQRRLTKQELYQQLESHFGVPPERIVNEYSMTELSSQFYTRGIGNLHAGPPWTRVRVIDPATGRDADEGGTGCLVIYDLANVDSVLAIRTQDLAIRRDGGRFELLGRDPAALPRGCSIAADEFHSKHNA